MTLLEYASFIYRNQLVLLDKCNYILTHQIKITLDFTEVFNFFSIFKNSSMREEIINEKSKDIVKDFLENLKLIRTNDT